MVLNLIPSTVGLARQHRLQARPTRSDRRWPHLLEKAVERLAQRHRAGNFLDVHIGHGAGHGGMLDPQLGTGRLDHDHLVYKIRDRLLRLDLDLGKLR